MLDPESAEQILLSLDTAIFKILNQKPAYERSTVFNEIITTIEHSLTETLQVELLRTEIAELEYQKKCPQSVNTITV